MSRPLRLEFAGALYHVTSRGDRQEDIYEDDTDRVMYLNVLSEVCDRFNWVCHAYCLMSNHYHLLIETPDANLSKGMRYLNGVYTQRFNRSKGRVGHVYQGRYKAILVEKQSYLVELARYIVLNPVRAEMVRFAIDWSWSSYRATVGQVEAPAWLNVDWLLASFSLKKKDAIKLYKQFIVDGNTQSSPWKSLRNQVYLGNDKFVEDMMLLVDGNKELSEIPSSQRRVKPDLIKNYEMKYSDRNLAIVKAYESGGYTLKEIGKYFGLHYSTVSGIVKGHKSKT